MKNTLNFEEPPANFNAWIVNLGTELLTGFTQNTNASWLARKLTFLGYAVRRVIVVPDDYIEFKEELIRGIEKGVGVIITTGGLGPTYDDSTLTMISRALSLPLEINDSALQMVKSYYDKLGKELTEERLKMAKMPRGAVPLENPVGAAPGMLLKARNSYIISLPGVPKEMTSIFEKWIEPKLSVWNRNLVIEETLGIRGIMESAIAPYLNSLVRDFPRAYIKTHPRGTEGEPYIVVQIMISSNSAEDLQKDIVKIKERLLEIVRVLGGKIE
ncbi:MAG: nicotinamide mononucleotide deamidase-related protein [Fervidicoccaceae archaeon]